ncbi:MAG: nucleotidyl transferase AbiEii/AbiGii toxin family protein [Candidatus Micrarchaeia archaeon]|jgi:predicted nucleotidyltransferase component of viral defense system
MKYDPIKVRRFAESLAALGGHPVSLVEKDVWITYALREIYALPEGSFLAFKGGTCLVKVYFGFYRFSEDIDLTWTGKKIKEHQFRTSVIERVMSELGLEWDYHDKVKTGIAGSHSGGIMNYFLLTPKADGKQSKLKITVAFDETLEFPPLKKSLKPAVPLAQSRELDAMFPKISSDYFSPPAILCYSLKEIACEKIRAVLTRRVQPNRSRDVVDLFVINKSMPLSQAAPEKAVKAKLSSALKIPAYAREYEKNTQNLHEHLLQLAAQVKLDSVFITQPNPVQLGKFIEELESYINQVTKNII